MQIISMEPLPQISIIICTNRAPKTIDELFLSLHHQSEIDKCEVILVDNGIVASQVARIRLQLTQLPCSSFYIDEPRPGLWHARGAAFAMARGEWMLLLDDDNELAEMAIKHLLDFVAKHHGVGGVSPRVVARWEHLPAIWLQRFGICCLSFTESDLYSPYYGETIWTHPRVPGIRPPGGGMIINRKIAGAFLIDFSLLPSEITQPSVPCEDHAIYCEVGHHAMATAYVPTIVVYHNLDASRTSLAALTRLNFRMIRGYGVFTPFELLFSGYDKGWLRLIGGVVVGQLRLVMLHPKTWWLVLVRLVAFFVGVSHGVALRNVAGRRGAGQDD